MGKRFGTPYGPIFLMGGKLPFSVLRTLGPYGLYFRDSVRERAGNFRIGIHTYVMSLVVLYCPAYVRTYRSMYGPLSP